MKYYLSSYKLGDNPERFLDMLSESKFVAYIPNAIDFTWADPDRVKSHVQNDLADLNKLGLEVDVLDLKNYFQPDQKISLSILNMYSGLWVSGGNVFVLRQAMKLSGIDKVLIEKNEDTDFVYGGYSAGCCVLSKSLKPYQIVDDATDFPYPDLQEVIWEGLGLIDFAFMPHFESEHPESTKISDEIAYCEKHNISYKAISDGNVLII